MNTQFVCRGRHKAMAYFIKNHWQHHRIFNGPTIVTSTEFILYKPAFSKNVVPKSSNFGHVFETEAEYEKPLAKALTYTEKERVDNNSLLLIGDSSGDSKELINESIWEFYTPNTGRYYEVSARIFGFAMHCLGGNPWLDYTYYIIDDTKLLVYYEQCLCAVISMLIADEITGKTFTNVSRETLKKE